MTDVVQKLWGFCDYLRHDGMNYGNYIEQLTYLLFLKMAAEKEILLPKNCSWDELITFSGSDLLEEYAKILQILGKQKGILGDIFGKSLPAFNNPSNLKKLLDMIDKEDWVSLDVDIKANAYEGLLEKYAANEKGAGQYFTPRPLIRSLMRCVRPNIIKSPDYNIHDPACGTCGFIIGAFEFIMKETDDGSKLKDKDKIRLVKDVFSGMDNVASTRRLGLMNCFLHEIEPIIYFGSALGDGIHVSKRYDLILTNPPFGSAGAGGISARDDFLIQTTNKQLNFIQHVLTILKPMGECVMVVPDGVLFSENGLDIRKHLLKKCNLHTILRLPDGTFSPYSPGTKANVIFFNKGSPTKEIWIYDARTNKPHIRKRKPLTEEIFADFEKLYLQKQRKPTERFQNFSIKKIEENNFDLNITFIEDENSENMDEIPEPNLLAKEISKDLKTAKDAIDKILESIKKN